MMLPETPTVPHSSAWSRELAKTRTLAAVPAVALMTRTLKVHQSHGFQVRVKLFQGAAKRLVQGIDRPGPFGHAVFGFPVHHDLERRFGHQTAGGFVFFHDHTKPFQIKKRLERVDQTHDQEIERRFRALEMIALVFQWLSLGG
jgi:hypothetical protein